MKCGILLLAVTEVNYICFGGKPSLGSLFSVQPPVQFDGALQLRSVLEQVALTLAVGETALEFEHGGLTRGHILVKESHDQSAQFWLNGVSVCVAVYGAEASIIDFSMARISQPPSEKTRFNNGVCLVRRQGFQ